jgi:riboflavin kinase / FMN adenylyltransferase
MDVVSGIASLPLDAERTVATVGFFDGVHLGHRAVLQRAVGVATERALPSVAVTFDRHPREVISPETAPKLLTTMERKAALIEELGLDVLVTLPFTPEFSRWSADEFLARVIRDGLAAAHVVIGANFTFGHSAAGSLRTLVERGPGYGFTAEGVPLVTVDGRAVSSSSIRDALAAGDLEWPARALGRRFALDGVVVAGAGRGAGLGYPTANLRTERRLLLPRTGIYAGMAEAAGRRHAAAISVGTNPTFGSEPLHVEAFLLDFGGEELRNAPILLEFWARLRDEERFDSPEALSAAIADDVRRTRSLVVDAW